MAHFKTLVDSIEDLLPQTQCTKCGYAGCRPYAEAIAQGTANYNQCPPGGLEGVQRLASLLGKPVIALNPANGAERPRPLAIIDENLCIGCTLCIQACPVDAIIGAPKQMHTVVASLCTGCDLCVAPCPVDCIAMEPITGTATGWRAWPQKAADAARTNHHLRQARKAREQAQAATRISARQAAADLASPPAQAGSAPSADNTAESAAKKRAIIQAALERARQKKATLAGQETSPKNTEPATPALPQETSDNHQKNR